jgi:hypothetical protein
LAVRCHHGAFSQMAEPRQAVGGEHPLRTSGGPRALLPSRRNPAELNTIPCFSRQVGYDLRSQPLLSRSPNRSLAPHAPQP